MRLYLCVLLRQHPIITQGVCLQMGGNKFMDVYISELGMDRRIQIEALQPAVVADFNKDSRQAAAVLLECNSQKVIHTYAVHTIYMSG